MDKGLELSRISSMLEAWTRAVVRWEKINVMDLDCRDEIKGVSIIF